MTSAEQAVQAQLTTLSFNIFNSILFTKKCHYIVSLRYDSSNIKNRNQSCELPFTKLTMSDVFPSTKKPSKCSGNVSVPTIYSPTTDSLLIDKILTFRLKEKDTYSKGRLYTGRFKNIQQSSLRSPLRAGVLSKALG